MNQGTRDLLVRNVLMRLRCNARAVSSLACDTESAIDKSVIFVYCEWANRASRSKPRTEKEGTNVWGIARSAGLFR